MDQKKFSFWKIVVPWNFLAFVLALIMPFDFKVPACTVCLVLMVAHLYAAWRSANRKIDPADPGDRDGEA